MEFINAGVTLLEIPSPIASPKNGQPRVGISTSNSGIWRFERLTVSYLGGSVSLKSGFHFTIVVGVISYIPTYGGQNP